jgi:hypothetical protein
MDFFHPISIPEKEKNSVEILGNTSMIDLHAEPVFHRYPKGGCHSGGGKAPENVMRNDDFYRGKKRVRSDLDDLPVLHSLYDCLEPGNFFYGDAGAC